MPTILRVADVRGKHLYWQDITFSDFEIKRGILKFLLVSKHAPPLIKYPTLKVREHLISPPTPASS